MRSQLKDLIFFLPFVVCEHVLQIPAPLSEILQSKMSGQNAHLVLQNC
jgi:hypothetical protein